MIETATAAPPKLKAPFPYFGGKSRVAAEVWRRFGEVHCYLEPFFGSGAALLARPAPVGREVVNDADGMVANFWRAVRSDPEAVAENADWPVIENDLHARNRFLRERRPSMAEALEADPSWCDPRAAGWWAWGVSSWIGADWARSTSRSLPRVAGDSGIHAAARRDDLPAVFAALSARLRRVKVACGDWNRILGRSTMNAGAGRVTAVFLDPPYSHAGRDPDVYAHDGADVARQVRLWCRVRGVEPNLRIALCGYSGEHDGLVDAGWSVHAWKAVGGYGNQGRGRGRANAGRERIWFSPHCLHGAA